MRKNLSRKAEMGMGTLIIFIALILVAAIAAAVLISTTSSLQNQALSTGAATTQEVGTSLNVVEIIGEDGSQNNSIDGLGSLIRLASGSDAIRFEDTLISLSLDNVSQDYRYNDSLDCIQGELENLDATHGFGIQYAIEGVSHREGYLVSGDVAEICMGTPRSIAEGESFRLGIIPRVGTSANVETSLPTLLLNQRSKIFP